ncbi:MAG: OmpA family protein [Ignavibacteriae bacterium]|nr:OmpA family protein [Ignavibacteriota bacterium]MCB9217694.1 OmpA family protein [Ignavibacteria bacterium]
MSHLRHLSYSFAFLISTVFLTGCPHQIEKLVDETIPPENYQPDYLKSNLSLEELAARYDSSQTSVNADIFADWRRIDSLRRLGVQPSAWPPDLWTNDTGVGSSGTSLIKMDIRSVDDSRYPDQIELLTYVFDTSGNYISGLAPPDFRGKGEWSNYWRLLIDSCNGAASVVESFKVEEVSEETRQPYSIAFILDHSASMGELRVRRLRKALALLLRGISKRDNVSVISFTDKNFVEVPLTGDKRKWVTSFDSTDLSTYGGGTALYDAAIAGIEEVARGPEDSRKVLVLFTDGSDGSSKAEVEDVHRKARENNVALYTIAYGPAEKDVLNNLAQYTGGRMYRIYRSKEFLDVFIDIYRRLNRFYRITYTPPECAGIHTARVFLALPEFNIPRLSAEGIYDRSVITPFDTVGSTVFLNIEFDLNKATIKPESLPLIREVADAMKRYPDMLLEVRGHTDDQGSDEYNLKLSERRADAVAEALIDMGVSRLRLSIKGFGESRPLVPNDSEENRRKNRRTEFVILSK